MEMEKRLTIPACVLGELDGLYTPVAYEDGTVDLYAGRVSNPSGYPEFICGEDGTSYLDMRGPDAPKGKAGGTPENLMAFAFRHGKTGRQYEDRLTRLRRAVRDAEDREMAYLRFSRDEGLEAILAPDDLPQEGRLAICQRNGEWLAIYTRDGAELTLEHLMLPFDQIYRKASAITFALYIRCFEEIASRYGLVLTPCQAEGILRAMRFWS